MINDLKVAGINFWKYVDDTTLAEIVPKGTRSDIQAAVDDICRQSNALKFTLNEDKCKEMRIQFTKSDSCQPSPITINDNELDTISEVKILGLTLRSDLKWNSHVNNIIKKASKRLYFLRQLKRANVRVAEMICFYCTCVRSLVEYASPVFHYGIPNYLCVTTTI